MNYPKCTMVVNSCDAYADTWYPFFKILKAQWPDFDMPVVLNTETKSFTTEDFQIITMNILSNKTKDIEWGERLIDVLNRIDSEYILFMLDDFFIQEPVRGDIVKQCIKWMDEDSEIVNFNLVPSGPFAKAGYDNGLDNRYEGFGLREKGDARLMANTGIWRRKDLIALIRPFESAWIWELYGSMRARRYKGKFYCCKYDAPPAFRYDVKRGGAIHKGLWVGCTVRPLLEKFNIKLDLEERGVDEDWLTHPPQYKRFAPVRMVRNRLKMIRSLFF